MAEKNTKENQKSKKKHKWIGIILIALLLLFIGLAGYYLERDLEPVPDDQIEETEVLDQNGEADQVEPDDSASEIVTEAVENDVEPQEEALSLEEEAEQVSEEESDSSIENGLLETEQDTETDTSTDTELDTEVETELDTETDIETPTEIEESAAEEETTVDNDEIEETEETLDNGEIEETEETSESKDVDSKEEKAVEEDLSEVEESSVENGAESDTEDIIIESEKEVFDIQENDIETDSSEVESEIQTESTEEVGEDELVEEESDLEIYDYETEEQESESDVLEEQSPEIEDRSLVERILSILGLSESNFSQDLNILFVGLDDVENVAIGTIEADSIMLARLRPEADMLEIEYIDEETIYQDDLLSRHYNGDLRLAVEEITDLEIDYHVYVNYQGFEKIIDELGGVQITLEQEIKVPGLGLNLKEGDNLLSGKEALNFIRWKDSDSISRYQRQKKLIDALMLKVKANNILFNVRDLYHTIVESYNSIETDINPVLAAEIINYIRENDNLELEFID